MASPRLSAGRFLTSALVGSACLVLGGVPAADGSISEEPGCNTNADLVFVEAGCQRSPDTLLPQFNSASSIQHFWDFVPVCDDTGGTCTEHRKCWEYDADGQMTQGLLSEILRDGDHYAYVCLSEEQAEEAGIPVITPGMVLREFRRLDWPASELQVQPPDQRTLVNFETNFFTDNTEPTTRRVTLLGRTVTIEATPASYTWRFDDREGSTRTGREPGAAYPDLQVTHAYTSAGQASPRVDTTYTGRYRVAGGPWQEIPESVTVGGTPVVLEVFEARSTLVAYD
jgi:hypothetical protein